MTYAIIIILSVIAVAFCVLVAALIPTIRSVKRTAESLASLQAMIQQELKPTIQELTSVLSEIKTVSSGVSEHTDDVKRLMSALGETGSSLHTINRTFGAVAGVLNTTSAWVTGARVTGKYLLERYLKKRGGN